jgi:predicted GNAT family acetyltransferase
MTDSAVLDNPIWNALNTTHAELARAHGLARRYPGSVSPLVGVSEPTAAALADLSVLVKPEEPVGLLSLEPIELPDAWQVLRTRPIEQMVCTQPTIGAAVPQLALDPADVPQMLALTAATEPGPFQPETIRMGRYFGIKSADGRLIAMAGERTKMPQFTEISAVCTDPNFQGRGHARTLMQWLLSEITREGKVPFLHVKAENGAKRLYEKLGFHVRRVLHLNVVARRSQ